MLHLIVNTAVNMLGGQSASFLRRGSRGGTQYCLGLYPWYDPVALMLPVYTFFSSSDTSENATSATSKIRSFCDMDIQRTNALALVGNVQRRTCSGLSP